MRWWCLRVFALQLQRQGLALRVSRPSARDDEGQLLGLAHGGRAALRQRQV
jgi:hypothetical protein